MNWLIEAASRFHLVHFSVMLE